jgi:hypothetical protein
MPRLGWLWSKIEGSDRANRDRSNEQFTHGTLLWLAPGVPLLSSLANFSRPVTRRPLRSSLMVYFDRRREPDQRRH